MQLFKSARQAQRFLLAHCFIYGHSHPRWHRISADQCRDAPTVAFKVESGDVHHALSRQCPQHERCG
jgi:hypothetical protein